jgi:hypothetical protein
MKSIAITIIILLLSRLASAETIEYKNGHPIRWDSSEITVTLDPSLETLGDDAYAIIEDAFIDWIDMSGIGIEINFEYTACTSHPYYFKGIKAENCVMAMVAPDEDWLGHDSGWLGTAPSTKTQYGEIVNADIIFDSQVIGWHDNLDCTVMHEVGHFFGLGHSEDVESMMHGIIENNCQRGITDTDTADLRELYAIEDDMQCSVGNIGNNSGSIWNLLF